MSEAGSLVAKPRDRWRVPSNRRQPFRKGGTPGNTHRWKALWAGKVTALDGAMMEAVLAPRDPSGLVRSPRGATGSVRGRSPALSSADNAGSWQHRDGIAVLASPNASRGRRRGTEWPKLGATPSSVDSTGAGLPQGGPALPGRTRSRSGKHPGVQAGASLRPGNRAVHGCSCRESVAEVGLKHLPHVVERRREAIQDGAG